MNINLNQLVDFRNRDLWEYLQTKFNIELDESTEPGFLTYFSGKTVVIEVDIKEMNPAAFTHELLHVYLKSKGLEIVWAMKEKVESDPVLREVFSTSLRVHIGNCLEHVKMLPLFLSRGFFRADFLRDYHKKLIKDSELRRLEKNYSFDGKTNAISVDSYIGNYFALRASVNPEFDYSKAIEILKKIDPSLFMILERFWIEWDRFELGDPKQKYLSNLNIFFMNIKDWRGSNNILAEKENPSKEAL